MVGKEEALILYRKCVCERERVCVYESEREREGERERGCMGWLAKRRRLLFCMVSV